jgi:hypothetical protein
VDVSELLYPLKRNGLPNVHEDYRSIRGDKGICSPEFVSIRSYKDIFNSHIMGSATAVAALLKSVPL